MLFKDYHIPMIRSGEKTVTRREWDEDYGRPNAGSVHIASTEMFCSDEEADCYIRIHAVGDRPLGTMSDADARAEGDYETLEEFRESYEGIYGEGSWDPEKVVTVVEFEYVGRKRPEMVTDGGTTKIAWTDHTWNPIHGCSRVSAGCDNCYAERLSYERHGWTDEPWTPENAEENVTLKPERLEPGGDGHPSQYDDPARIFVNSMSDVFHSQVPDEFIQDLFAEMRNYPEHVFQILTKRPGRAANMPLDWPPNVWMGTSVEDERVINRLDLLRDCDAKCLFVSFEPLIGPVGDVDLTGYDWVIVGGESGPDYREMSHEWVWPIRRECMRRDVAFFFKQSSAPMPEQEPYLRCPDGQRREFREMPPLHPAVRDAREKMEVSAA